MIMPEMEEAMANVRKYTGMTTEEVKDLERGIQKNGYTYAKRT